MEEALAIHGNLCDLEVCIPEQAYYICSPHPKEAAKELLDSLNITLPNRLAKCLFHSYFTSETVSLFYFLPNKEFYGRKEKRDVLT